METILIEIFQTNNKNNKLVIKFNWKYQELNSLNNINNQTKNQKKKFSFKNNQNILF